MDLKDSKQPLFPYLEISLSPVQCKPPATSEDFPWTVHPLNSRMGATACPISPPACYTISPALRIWMKTYLCCHLKKKQLVLRKRIASCWVKCVSWVFRKKQESCRAGGRTVRWSLMGALGAIRLVKGSHDEALPQSLGHEPAEELDNN